MTLQEASEAATILRNVFSDVYVDGVHDPITVRAKGHDKMPKRSSCQHAHVRRARNVLACVQKGYIVSADERHTPIRYDHIDTCLHCDAIQDSKRAEVYE